jgi:hypothetical protein
MLNPVTSFTYMEGRDMRASEKYGANSGRAMALAAVVAAAIVGLASCDGDDNVQPVPSELCCDPNTKPGVGTNPICTEGVTCCGDGSWQCNQATGENTCQNYGGLCEITECNPDDEPGVGDNAPCIEGATCCPDGQWHCNDFGGAPDCG